MSGRGVKSIIELINFNECSLAKAVLDYSNLHQADLIIMTQQENNFIQYLIGSTDQSFIYNSEEHVNEYPPRSKDKSGVFFPIIISIFAISFERHESFDNYNRR